MRLDAMSLNISHNEDHPNKMPFSGVLTRIDEPSNEPPGGSNGRRVVVTKAAAEKALGSLLGMGVDFTPLFDGHDTQAKIGIIMSATIVGNAIEIEGFVYAADFPEVAASIKSLQSALGFSFEAERILVEDPGADILRIVGLAFTGAAILRKDRAAYQTTSLAASAEWDIAMTAEEMKALLGDVVAEAVKPLTERLDKIEAEKAEKIEANATTIAMVEPHAHALESCAAAMEAAGIGLHPQNGHAVVVRRAAGSTRAAAAVGKVPHIFRDHDYPMDAASDSNTSKDEDMTPEDVTKAVEAAMKPILDKLAAAETQIADIKATARREAPAPERKTVSPMVTALLAKAGLAQPEGDEKLTLAKVDESLRVANLPTDKRIMLKNELTRVGAL